MYLTDLHACLPTDALSRKPKRGTWRIVDYAADGFTGSMLVAGEETAAPEIAYRLNRKGRHRISIGLYADHTTCTVQVRLTRDRAATGLHIDRNRDCSGTGPNRHEIYEAFWKDDDLTGQDLCFSQVATVAGTGTGPAATRCFVAKIAYVKIVPLSEAEAAGAVKEHPEPAHRCLYAHNDAHGPLFHFRVARTEEILREIEPYRDTDFSRLYWEAAAGDVMYYLGRKGRLPTCDGREDFERQGDRLHAESWRMLLEEGIDPLKTALEYTHELGMEFHAAYRTAGFYYPVPFDQWNTGGLYEKRPELRSVEKDGSSAPRISYSYPETRRFVISLLAEIAEYRVDGIAILFNRRPPLVGYEAPIVEGFRREFGEDARRLPDDDERWLRYRAVALTDFMRELRGEMDAIAERQGRSKRINISACVPNRVECFRYGLDLETWIREDLMDTLIPYTSADGLDSAAESWKTRDEVEYFVSLSRGTRCRLSMSVLPRHMSPVEYCRKLDMLYQAGVESFFFWDCAGFLGRANCGPSWNILRRAGHREEVRKVSHAATSPMPRSVRLTRLGDYDLSYQTPG